MNSFDNVDLHLFVIYHYYPGFTRGRCANPRGNLSQNCMKMKKNINEGGVPRAARSGTETFDIWYIYGPQSQDPQSLFHLLWLPDSVFVRDWYSHEYSKPTASNVLKSMECLMLSEDHQYSSLHSGAMPSDCAFLEWLLPYFVGEQKWYSIKSFSGGQFDYFLFVFISRPVSSEASEKFCEFSMTGSIFYLIF